MQKNDSSKLNNYLNAAHNLWVAFFKLIAEKANCNLRQYYTNVKDMSDAEREAYIISLIGELYYINFTNQINQLKQNYLKS